ncbi:MAG: IclR family transcriptional regulator, partial [Acidimicrobiales bacterium]
MVIVDRAGPVRPNGLTVAVGYRFPLVPPMGTVFMAWSSPEEIDEWLRRVGPDVTEAELDRYRLALGAVRGRGYSAGLDADGSRSLAEAQAGDLDGDEYQLIEMGGAEEYRVTTIGAPVFDTEGAVALGVFILGFRDALTAEQVPDVAERLMKATGAITESIHGRLPR